MAFFGLFNFDKPGPGVNKDEPPKAAPIRYFEIYFRKFTKLCQANLIFFLPVAAAVALMVFLYIGLPHFVLHIGQGDSAVEMDVWTRYVVPLPLILVSPFAAGLTLITRNFAREEHAFVWSDFWDAVRDNWKYFLLNGVVVYAAYVILSFAITFYGNRAAQESLYYVPFWMCVLFSVLFLFAQYYLPIMFVTFDLKFGQAYKNAMIFILAGFGRNLLLTVLFGGLLFLVVTVIPLINLVVFIFALLLLFVVFAWVSYTVNFTVYPVINRYMIQPYEKQQAIARGELPPDKTPEEVAVEKQENAAFYAPPEVVAPDEPSEEDGEVEEDPYVFIRGKLVKKSELSAAEREELGE